VLIPAPRAVEDVRSLAWRNDPYPFFARWRACEPALRLDWPRRGAGDWLVTRHEDVAALLADPRFAIDRAAARGEDILTHSSGDPNAPLQHTVLTADGPVYHAMRARLTPVLAGVSPAVEALIQSDAARIARRACARERFDMVSDFAQPLCESIWAGMMRLEPAAMPKLSRLTEAYLTQGFIFGGGVPRAAARDAVAPACQVLTASLPTRAAADEIGFLTRFIAACEDPEGSAMSLANTALLLTAAMLQSTKHGIVNAVAAMMAQPEAWQALRRSPDIVPQLVEECLRFDGPSLAVGRIAMAEISIAGETIAPGAFVRLAVASANRDEARLPCADAFDIQRPRRPHLGFGRGLHACSGAKLARVILGRSLVELGERLPEPILDEGNAVRDTDSSLRGYRRLPVITRRGTK
jgi:cytochrome P450